MGNKPSLPVNEAIYAAAKQGKHTELETILRNARPETRPESLLEWQDEDGRTALIVAAAKNHIHAVEMLLRYRANVQHMSRRREGGTALHEAIYKQVSPRIIDSLLKYGASPFVENVSRFTAMDYAIVRKDAAALRRLERCGYFSQYMHVRLKKNFGFSKIWAPRWIAIVPRHGCPLRSQQLSRRMLFVYYDAKGYDPISKLYLDGSTSRAVVGNYGHNQALVVLHHTHEQPKLFAAEKDAGGKWIINFRPLNDDVTVVNNFVQGVTSRHDIPVKAHEGEDDETFAKRLAGYGSGVGQLPEGIEEEVAEMMEPLHHVPSVHPEHRSQNSVASEDPESSQPAEVIEEYGVASVPQESTEEEYGDASAPPLPPEYYGPPPVEGISQSVGVPLAPPSGPDESPEHPSYAALGQDSLKFEDDDGLCVVCLDKPKTCGFVHGTSMHRCVCCDCAKTLKNEGDGLCPVCRQPVEHIITDFF